MRSMTGFGRGQGEGDGLRVVVEVKSVNQRGLDVKTRLPKEIAGLEPLCLAAVKKVVVRGRVDVAAAVERVDVAAQRPLFDAAAAERLVDEILAFARRRPAVAPTLTAGDLLRVRDLVVAGDEDLAARARPVLGTALDAALADLTTSRDVEGRGLEAEIRARLDAAHALVGQLRAATADAPKRQREKLRARLAAEGVADDVDPARLAAEIALLADRLDVAEELARLEVHLGHFRRLLADEDAVGRKLDFLCQELMREANTTGSKVADAPAAHLVVDLKAEIERVREQAQNVE